MSTEQARSISQTLLRKFVDGKLDPDQEVQIAATIESSPSLQAEIAALSSDDFLKRIQSIAAAHSNIQEVLAEPTRPNDVDSFAATISPDVLSELAATADYEVLKELGRGGMGVVYLAKYIPMNRLEVLKVLSNQLAKSASAKKRFQREIQAIGNLNHRSIATAYQQVQLENYLVFSMEYVPGIDLHRFIQNYHPIPVPIACHLIIQIAEGLQHAHGKHMVHRDIKPSNVMVYQEEGSLMVKILDFGLAKASSEQPSSEQPSAGLTGEGTMLGTPEYMAPEQIVNAARADIRADIYSLGCTFYHLLSGKPPFTGTAGAILMAHAQRDEDCISLDRADVPSGVMEVLGKMMAKEVSRRYSTPSDVARTLQPFAGAGLLKLNSSADIAKVDTLLDLASPSRDTSVEAPSPRSAPFFDSLNASNKAVSQNLGDLESEVRQPMISARTQSPPSFANRRMWPLVLTAVGALFCGVFFLAVALTIKADDATLVIENLPDDAIVEIDGRTATLRRTVGEELATISIKPGTHQVEVKSSGVTVFGESVAIQSGADVAITVTTRRAPTSIPIREDSNGGKAETDANDASATTGALRAKLGNPVVVAGIWHREGEEIVQSAREGKDAMLQLGDKMISDFDLDLEAKATGDAHDIKIFFHCKGESVHDRYLLCLGGYKNRGHELSFDQDSKWDRADGMYSPGSIEASRWHRVRIEVRKSKYRCFLDGEELFNHRDSQFAEGRIALGACDSTVSYRNVVVTVYDSDGATQGRFLPSL